MVWEKKWFQLTILMLLAFVWGSSFILMKIGLKSFSSNQAAAIRMFSASLVLFPFSLKSLKVLRKKDLKSLLVAGFIGSFIPAFLFTKAQTRIDSALAGMLNSLTPVFTLLVGGVIYKTKPGRRQYLGLLLGVVGAASLILSGSGLNIENVNGYVFFIVLATICYAFSINEIKTRLTHLSGIQITSLSFLLLGPVSLLYLLSTNFSSVIEVEGWPLHLLALSVLGIIGTASAMLVMNSIIRHTSALFVSSVTYVIPVFAVMWGLLDGERITIQHMAFMSVILFGVYMINKK